MLIELQRLSVIGSVWERCCQRWSTAGGGRRLVLPSNSHQVYLTLQLINLLLLQMLFLLLEQLVVAQVLQ